MRITTILILFATTQCVYCPKPATTTVKIEERVRLLKEKIRNSLRHPSKPDPTPAYEDSDENAPIPPILEDDALKKNEKYRMRTIKKYTPKRVLRTRETTITKAVAMRGVLSDPANVTRIPPMIPMMHLTTGSFSMDIFYRRSFLDTPIEWLHCSELVTPLIKGVKKEVNKEKMIHLDDHLVTRFIQLLSANTTKLTRAEKKSIMYQISILNVRLFSWDTNPLTVLLKLIAKAGGSNDRPTFANLKAGVKALLARWTMDLSNTTALLLQARIFRPPCFSRNDGGSSKLVRGSTLPARTLRQRISGKG